LKRSWAKVESAAKTNRCLIITAGPMGPYKPLKRLPHAEDFIVCADGGLIHARKLGLKADVLIGDLDSLDSLPDEGMEVLRFKKEKDETDTILAIDYALEKGYRDFLILGGMRGRLDHTFANFSALLHLHRRGGTGYFADAQNEARMLISGEMRLRRREGFYISIFPFGGEALGVTARGLKYPLENAGLDCGFPLGVSNEFAAEEAVISVEKGNLLIILSKE
jgi:thiamine pyrophosphokinase